MLVMRNNIETTIIIKKQKTLSKRWWSSITLKCIQTSHHPHLENEYSFYFFSQLLTYCRPNRASHSDDVQLKRRSLTLRWDLWGLNIRLLLDILQVIFPNPKNLSVSSQKENVELLLNDIDRQKIEWWYRFRSATSHLVENAPGIFLAPHKIHGNS